ncbi:glutathione transferase [Janthinobacterium sp. B9-8]|uniref:glutathione transferase n=1 Tax=Janthinobacterium sp. B9-8 TaxID=1236179 RepID=UPI00061D340D|nr:glutathione transferase [Janthinobacterium sp. B9-8]AMC34536.1 glutathione S-transferase [Janthinobacterium sp. B9-8]
MKPAPFTLYADSLFTSPYAMSVFVSLLEKDLPFEVKTLNLDAGEQQQQAFRQQSLTSRVPTLVQGDFSLSESSAISEYLEELFPAPEYVALYPTELQQRAKARQIQAWLRSDLLDLRIERSTNVVFFAPSDQVLSSKGQAAADKLIAAADLLIKEDQANLFEQWCIADTDLALMLNRLIKNGDPVPAKLVNYANAQWQRTSVQQWLKQKG